MISNRSEMGIGFLITSQEPYLIRFICPHIILRVFKVRRARHNHSPLYSFICCCWRNWNELGQVWGIRQATINCNSKSLKLQQITGGKLTAKQLRCRHRRSRRSSREMSTCGSRRRQQLLPLCPQSPELVVWSTACRVRRPELSFPFIVIFSANFRFFSFGFFFLFCHFGHWL